MKIATHVGLSFVLLAVGCLGQTGRTLPPRNVQPIHSDTTMVSSGSIMPQSFISGDVTVGVVGNVIGNSATLWCQDSRGVLTSCFSATRKDDGKGPTIQLIRASAHRLSTKDLAPAAYISLAKSVGMMAPLEEAELLQAIHEAQLTVYDFHQVDEYLWRQAARMKSPTEWVWKPLRDADLVAGEKVRNQEGWSAPGLYRGKLYPQRVPMKVLADMHEILEKIPNAVFLVSDFEAVKPDPFLAVSTPKLLAAGKLWIVDQWDEPGFGEEAVTVIASAR